MMKTQIKYKEMWDFQLIMHDDIKRARSQALEFPDQFNLRTIIRTTAAYIEGTVFQLRCVCLAACEDVPNFFTPEEVLALKEKTVTLDQRGNIKEKDDFQKIQSSILFTFSCFAKLHKVTFRPNIGEDNRWDSFNKFVKIRNSLMHPKNQEDFEITESKNKFCAEALGWFHDNLKELYRFCEKVDEISREEK